MKTFKEKYNNYSNFTKINNNYTTYVFKQIEFEYRHGIPDNDMNLLDSILYKASDEDFLRNKALLEKYVNVVYVDAASESNVPESVSAEIKERLIAYRTKTYKLNRISTRKYNHSLQAAVLYPAGHHILHQRFFHQKSQTGHHLYPQYHQHGFRYLC